MKLITNIAIGALAFTAVAGTASAQQTATAKTGTKPAVHTTKKTETEADLAKIATVSKDSATKIALARVPGATVKSGEIDVGKKIRGARQTANSVGALATVDVEAA